MASNMPGMVPNPGMMMPQQQQQLQQLQQQQTHPQLKTLVYSHLMSTMSMAPSGSWQNNFSTGDRFNKALNLVSNTILAFPNNDWQTVCKTAMDFEKKAFLQSPDKDSYDQAMTQRVNEMMKRRQALLPQLQDQINNEAARQAQIQQQQAAQARQQLMLQQLAAQRMGQQITGFPPMQKPMQVPGMPPQAQQLPMGMANPGMLQTAPGQRPFPVQMAQARPQQQPGALQQLDPLSRLTPEERMLVNDRVMLLLRDVTDQHKSQLRQLLQQKMAPAQWQAIVAQGKDPVFVYYQQQAINLLRSEGQLQPRPGMAAAGMPSGVMPPGATQGPMNPGLIGGLPPGVLPDGQVFPAGMANNQRNLINQRVAGVAGVGPGPNPAANAMGGLPQQATPGTQPGPTQTPRPASMPGFNMGKPNMDPAAAAAAAAAGGQVPAGMRPVPGQPMPGQPGQPNTMPTPNAAGLPQAQNPGMNQPNPQMRPGTMGQMNQAMNQGNAPGMAATLNPNFSHTNNTRPQSLPPNIGNPALAGMMQNLNPDAQQAGMTAAGVQDNAANIRNFYARLANQQLPNSAVAGAKPNMPPGMMGQPPQNPLAGPNQAGAVNVSMAGNAAMPAAAQVPTLPQQQPPQGQTPQAQQAQIQHQQLLNFAHSPQGRMMMNTMDISPVVLEKLRQRGLQIPPEIRKWNQLRQFLMANPNSAPPQWQMMLDQWQLVQLKGMVMQQQKKPPMPAPGVSQLPNARPPQPPGAQPPMNLPPGFTFPPSIDHITRQDLDTVRAKDARFRGLSDEHLTEFLKKSKREAYIRKAWEQYHQMQRNNAAMQRPGMPGMPGMPPTTTTAAQPTVPPAMAPPQPMPNMAQVPQPQQPQPQPQQMVPPKPATTVPPAEMSAATAPGGARPGARPQPPQPSPAPAPKNLKRPNEETNEAPNQQQANAAQRPPQQPPAQGLQRVTMEQLMKLTQEQLAKISPEQLARLPQEMQAYVLRARAQGVQAAQAAHAAQAAQAAVAYAPQGNNESIARLKEIAAEAQRLWQMEMREPEVPVPASDVNEARVKLVKALDKIKQLRGHSKIATWYHLTRDDARAKMFFKTRFKVAKHFDEATQQLRPGPVTMSLAELDQYINMMDSMLQDIGILKRTASQEGVPVQNQAQSQQQQPPHQQQPQQQQQPPQPQPAPLNAANLEKQAAALRNAQNRVAQKPSQPGQPPAAPTTTQPPFQFNAGKSPAGNPQYLGEPRLSQDNLVMPPARKKAKTNAQPSPSMQQQPAPTASPQITAPSPAPAPAAVKKPEPPKLTCPEPGCEMASIGFPTEEALQAHRQEEHVKPYENPMAFMKDQLASALGLELDAQGKPVQKPKNTNNASAGATPMSISQSTQGQKLGAQAMSRVSSTQQGKAAAPSGTKPPATPATAVSAAAPAAIESDPWAGATIDPNDLMTNLTQSLEAITGTIAPEFGTYRSLTPNDTPESSKDSGASEPTSDIAQDASLDIDINWQSALDGDMLYDLTNVGVENFEAADFQGLFGNGSGGFGDGGSMGGSSLFADDVLMKDAFGGGGGSSGTSGFGDLGVVDLN